MQLEIRHARLVAVLASAGSISKAAAQLALPQPSLTLQLRRIEKVLGGELFVRSRSGITPTPLGARVIPMLVELAASADAVLAEATVGARDVLRIGIAEWTPVTLRDALSATVSGMDVRTETLDPVASVDAVCQGTLAAAVISSANDVVSPDPVLASEIIVREPVWVALPKEHELARRPVAAVNYSQLSALPWVRHVRSHWFAPVEENLFGRMDRLPNVVHQVGGHAEAMTWVRDAGAVAAAPSTGASPDVSLVRIPDAPRSHLLLVWRRGTIPKETLGRLLYAVRRYYCEYARTIGPLWSWMIRHPDEFPQLAGILPGVTPPG